MYDNALVINDYSDFNVFINNEKYSTEVGGDDGKWHHIAVSWASSTGNVIFYKDGSPVSQGKIQQNKVSSQDQKEFPWFPVRDTFRCAGSTEGYY